MTELNQNLIDQLNLLDSPQALIKDLFERFHDRAIIGTSGQLTGVVLIDMAVQAGIKPRVFTLDTLRLFPESYALFNDLEARYGIEIERIQPDPQKLERMVNQHGEYLFFDTKEKQEFCCHVRKVEPQQRVLKTVDVWLTGLRSDQSKNREKTRRIELIEDEAIGHPVLKIAPLFNWSEEQVRDYIQEHQVPIHRLLEENNQQWYYESIGCVICTTPIGRHEPRRAGRWRWFNNQSGASDKKECGIHINKEEEV